jgi:Rod binding domain-containing protein
MKTAAANFAPHRATTAPLTPHQRQLARQAQKWVSQTFFGTLMKQMHDSPFKSNLLDGGRGGEAFQPLMDQHLAERMSRGAGQKLVRSIVKQLERRERGVKRDDVKRDDRSSPITRHSSRFNHQDPTTDVPRSLPHNLRA